MRIAELDIGRGQKIEANDEGYQVSRNWLGNKFYAERALKD